MCFLFVPIVCSGGSEDGHCFSSQWFQWQVSLVLQVNLVPRDLLALLALQVKMAKVSVDPKDLLDLLDLLAAPSLANLDLQVDLANLAALENLVREETLEPLAPRDLGESLDLLEALDQLVSLLLASLVLQVYLEQWVPEESLV